MGKRSKRNRNNSKAAPLEGARPAPNQRPSMKLDDENIERLKFQDPFVDELIDETEEIEKDGDDGSMDNDGDDGLVDEVVCSWHPLMGRQGSDQAEALEMDPSAYKMYHTLTPEWPSLSFDFLKDYLGDSRQRFPHSLQAAIGTQADIPENNHITILKLSDLSKLPKFNEVEEDILGDEYDKPSNEDSDSDSEDEALDVDPVLEHYHIPHYGGINRIRAMPQKPDIVATWSDVGSACLFNVENIRSRFASSEGKATTHGAMPAGPFFTHQGHSTEGFALDWSLVQEGYLASGDNNGGVHLWKPRPEGVYEVTPTYTSESGVSVEDIQWSPTERTVLATAEGGGHLSIYDTRAPNRSMLRHLCHPDSKADVNVTSWNRLVSNLLTTGGDDGTLSVWDLRQFTTSEKVKPVTPLARFTCHQTPITSVEWHPTDESMLAVSDVVGAYIYDLSVEEDTDTTNNSKEKLVIQDIPPQLLFCHSGSQEFKELHWHPQISSCIMTTAFSGFSVFIPSNL